MASVLLLCAALFLSWGCTCPELIFDDIRVREATITQFDPRWNTAQNTPVPTYSIHTFLFPSEPTSSGSLPNDDRIAFGNLLVVEQQTFQANGQTYTAQAVTDRPPNWIMRGDWMVVEVDSRVNPPQAWIRVAGQLSPPLSDRLFSASAEDFVNYLQSHRQQFNDAARRATPSGAGIPDSRQLPDVRIRILDAQGDDVTGSVSPPPEILEMLRTALEPAIDVRVQIGEVYYYRAKNGSEFAVLIEDIRPGTLPPNLNRMTIKFAQVPTTEGCQAP